jgi:hypothetical protein
VTLSTVVFATCDSCGERWETPPGYHGTPMAFDDLDVRDVDLCPRCWKRLHETVQPLLSAGRPTDLLPEKPKRSHTRRSTSKGEWICSCGEDFQKKMHITRHLGGSRGQGHHIASTPDGPVEVDDYDSHR